MKKRLLVIGSAGVRLRLGCERLPYAGEKAAGTKYAYSPDCLAGAAALAAARMGVESVLLARVGQDSNGTKLISVLDGKGVDTRFMVRDRNCATSLSVVIDEDAADMRTITYRGAASNLTSADVEEAFNCYPDCVLLRIEGSKDSAVAAERFAKEKDADLYVSIADNEDEDSIHLPSKIKAFVGDAKSVRTVTGIAPSNSDTALRAALELSRKCSVEYTVFRMNSGCIYLYDGKYGRILDITSKGQSFCDIFAPALIAEYLRCGNFFAAARFAAAATSLWEACGETLESVPTTTEVRRDQTL
ncbi:MAG: hypothetical protein E7578_01870 [Ruminococcaceae bacterium]|nr:hypothetical protein [Oscillospiraceae bacterium]